MSQGELKRALVDGVADILGDGLYRLEAISIVDFVLAKLAAGSPEVIAAMLEAMRGMMYPRWTMEDMARAALAAGMKKVMES